VSRLPLTALRQPLVADGNGSSVNGKRSTVNSPNTTVDPSLIYQHLSIAAPYLELVEEMTATEALQFHAAFKPLLSGISIKEILEIVGLKAAANKQIRFYSSGMKQRMKLAQAIFSDVPILLLDEPCTNLDAVGYALYHQLIKDYCAEKLVIVCSNDIQEFDFCTEKLDIMDYKPAAKG
jgi:ABC-type multidrug transport system ATPase subunit